MCLLAAPLVGCTGSGGSGRGSSGNVQTTREIVGFSTNGATITAERWHANTRRGRSSERATSATISQSATTPPRLYVIGGIHGDEPEGLESIDAISQLLAHRARQGQIEARFVHDMNPDGTKAGTRGNARGVDLNRNWPASNYTTSRARGARALSEPESDAVHRDMQRFNPEIIVVLHSTPRGPFVNFDGPSPASEDLAQAFVDGAKSTGDPRWKVVPDMGYPTPGSMGSYFGSDLGLPILTIEFKRGETGVTPSAVAGLAAMIDAAVGRSIESQLQHHRISAAGPGTTDQQNTTNARTEGR